MVLIQTSDNFYCRRSCYKYQHLYIQSMYRKKELQHIDHIQSIPTEYTKRTCTDVFCLILGLVFSLVLFILAIVLFNYNKFVKANFPSDSNGVLCGIQKQGYPYVYFAHPPNIDRRVCVQSCPNSTDQSLKCVPTSDIGCRFSSTPRFEVLYYDNQPVNTRSGYFCMPKDQSLRQKIQANSNLQNRQILYKSLDTIILCFLVALGFSIIYLLFVQFMPKAMNYAAVILGMLVLLASAICIFTYYTQATAFKIVIGCLVILAVIVIAFNTFRNMDSLRIHGIFLTYATKFIKDRPATLLYIPLFLIFLLAFIAIVVLEFNAFWTAGDLLFDSQNYLFYNVKGTIPIVLTVFLAVQTIWGLVFLKMSFNFCVSGEAVNWCYSRKEAFCQPLKYLLCLHLGSVIGGSFIIGFFTIFDFMFDFIKPKPNSDPNSAYSKCYNSICGCALFDLVRTDAMAFINLTGNPYCNSARYCEYLCNRSLILDNSQSTSRFYRLCAHILLIGIMLIFAMYIKGVISIYTLIIITINTIFVSTLFISLHADAAEAIQITMLADQELSKRGRASYDDSYGFADVENSLAGLKLHRELVDEIKNQRVAQLQKRQNRSKYPNQQYTSPRTTY